MSTKVKNPPSGMQRITPQLYYQNVERAISWLANNFKLDIREQPTDTKGKIIYAEMGYRDSVVILAPDSRFLSAMSPKDIEGFSASIHLYIDEIENFYLFIQERDIEIIENLTKNFWGDITFRVKDYEGHLWTFAEHIEDVVV